MKCLWSKELDANRPKPGMYKFPALKRLLVWAYKLGISIPNGSIIWVSIE